MGSPNYFGQLIIMTTSKITPACLFVDTFYCPFMPLDQNSKHSFSNFLVQISKSDPATWLHVHLPPGPEEIPGWCFWRLFRSWPFDIGAAPSTGGDTLNHEPEYLPRSRFFKDFEMEPNALWSKGWHFWEKKAIMLFSTLEVDFSAKFHPIHDFIGGGSLNAPPKRLENEKKSNKYQFFLKEFDK